MTKEEIKALVRENLQSKRIILFGAGVIAEEFYQEHKECLRISHCVSNLPKEWGEGAFLGELDVRQYKQEEVQEDDYIVVCGPLAFRIIELQLEAVGLKMYEHYIESKLATAILENKKIAVFYGQCIMRDIYHCIIQIPAFQEVYTSIFTQVVHEQAIIINRLLYYAKNICDLYVYTPKILDRDSIYAISKEEFSPDCIVMSVSNLMVFLYWPQVSPILRKPNEYYLYPYDIKRDEVFGHTLYQRGDLNINKMVLQGVPTKKIVDQLSNEDFYSEKQIWRHKEIFFKSVGMAEKAVDITILDYLEDNYTKVPLYQNFAHPHNCIIWEYVKRLLLMLGLSIEGWEDLKEELDDVAHRGGEVPIYPSTAKHLKLEFINEQTRYEVIVGNGVELMTFREYIEHYAEYTRKAVEIIQML